MFQKLSFVGSLIENNLARIFCLINLAAISRLLVSLDQTWQTTYRFFPKPSPCWYYDKLIIRMILGYAIRESQGRISGFYFIYHQWRVLFARSDWLLKLGISTGYLLVCKTQWTRARVITFPAEFWPDEIQFFCRWLFTGLVYTPEHNYSPQCLWIAVDNLPRLLQVRDRVTRRITAKTFPALVKALWSEGVESILNWSLTPLLGFTRIRVARWIEQWFAFHENSANHKRADVIHLMWGRTFETLGVLFF